MPAGTGGHHRCLPGAGQHLRGPRADDEGVGVRRHRRQELCGHVQETPR